MKLAAVTMVYNEAEYLPFWVRHYGAAVGLEHCHIVDHGSTDSSTAHLAPANHLRLPRSPHDDIRRAAFMSHYCASLLEWYDAVIHTDVDEFVVTDPARHLSLHEYTAAMPTDVETAIGFNLMHLSREEPPLNPARALLDQRQWAWFTSSMCKPVLIRRKVAWAPGFHSADAEVSFGSLFLFHARYADRSISLARLARTRAMQWADLQAGDHQRVADAPFSDMQDRMERMDRVAGVSFDRSSPPLSDLLSQVIHSQIGREAATYRIALDINNYQLWQLPPAFAAAAAGSGA
jgi:hypothetical protein